MNNNFSSQYFIKGIGGLFSLFLVWIIYQLMFTPTVDITIAPPVLIADTIKEEVLVEEESEIERELPCENYPLQVNAKEAARNRVLIFKNNLVKIARKGDFFGEEEKRDLIKQTLKLFTNPTENYVEIIKSYKTGEKDSYPIEEYLGRFLGNSNRTYQISWDDAFHIPDFTKNEYGEYETKIQIRQEYRKFGRNENQIGAWKELYADVTYKVVFIPLSINGDECTIKIGNIIAEDIQKLGDKLKT